ncbi:MAG: hypothetical protein CMJ58_04555 [Planctomycetaceae bacterium]|nr:hypothetical protein [Planctomycetaceae bacterium]
MMDGAGFGGLFAAIVVCSLVSAIATGSAAVEPLPPGWSRAFGGQSTQAEEPAAANVGIPQLPAAVDDMQTAGRQLAAAATIPDARSSQGSAIARLDAALAQLQQQCQQCMGGKRSKPGERPGQPKPSSKRGGANPNGAAVATGQGGAGQAAADAAQQVRDLWGSLPQRQRDAMLQPLREEFLPEYADQIEAYYRELANPDDAAGSAP